MFITGNMLVVYAYNSQCVSGHLFINVNVLVSYVHYSQYVHGLCLLHSIC